MLRRALMEKNSNSTHQVRPWFMTLEQSHLVIRRESEATLLSKASDNVQSRSQGWEVVSWHISFLESKIFFPDPCPSLYYYQPYPETKLKDTLTRDKKVLQMGLSPTQKWWQKGGRWDCLISKTVTFSLFSFNCQLKRGSGCEKTHTHLHMHLHCPRLLAGHILCFNVGDWRTKHLLQSS